MLTKDRVVAVGLLTQRDLDALGTEFHRLFTIANDDDQDDGFADLLTQLEKIDAVKLDRNASCAIRQHLGGG